MLALNNPCFCRAKAEECRQHVERGVSAVDKERWLMLVAEWLRLAEEAERRER
jgi:hypothetical protein